MLATEEYQLSPREHAIMETEVEEARLAREHAITLKRMELALAEEEHRAEIALKTLEAKWNSWIKIPVLIIKLPILIVLAIAYIVACVTKKEMPKKYWDLMSW